MQPENSNNTSICKLCVSAVSCTNSKVIEKAVRDALEVILPTLNLEERYKHLMCDACCSKLFPAFNFKTACMDTENIIFPYINAGGMSVVELKEIYLKVNGNIELSDMQENLKICRLCLQLLTYGFVSLNEVDSDIIDAYIPQVNINATKNPVICEPCFNSLTIHGDFVKSCLKAQEKYKSGDKQLHIKSEETCIKLEDDHDAQDENIDKTHIKYEEIEMKAEEGNRDDCTSHNLDEETTENKRKHISEDIGREKDEYMFEWEPKIEIHKCKTLLSTSPYNNRYETIRKYSSEIEVYKCNTCTYETRDEGTLEIHQLAQDPSEIQMYKCDTSVFGTEFKNHLKTHQLTHKDPSEIKIYKCDVCHYETNFKSTLKRHHLTHKDPSEIQMYKCDSCAYETKYKTNLKGHQLTHKHRSEIKMYKCDVCHYETKRKEGLKSHQMTHKYPSEIQMYTCDVCDYETKYKNALKYHQLTHKDPSEVHMYRCDACDYETKHKSALKCHQITHKDPSEIQMHRCDACGYETKHKGDLKIHQLTHKEPSEIKMYKCDFCTYETKYKKSLKHHQLRHKDPSEIVMYKCHICNYETKRKGSLTTHQLVHRNSDKTLIK